MQRVIEGESFEIRRTLRKYSYCLERQRRAMHERRQKLMRGADSPSLLRDGDPDLFEKLTGEFGDEVVQKVERQITLCQLDRCWSDHLAHVAEVREGIHLVSIGGLNAFDEFNRQINAAFREYSTRVEQEVLATLRTVQITADGIDLKKGRAPRAVVHMDLHDQRQSDGRHVGQAEVAALEAVGEPRVVDAQAVQDRGVEVVDVDGVSDDVVAVVVGLAVGDAGLDAAAGQPHREAAAVVVAAVVVLGERALAVDRCGRTRRPR